MAQQVEPVAGAPSGAVTTSSEPTSSATDAAKQEAVALKDRAAEAASTVGRSATDEVGALKDEAMGDARHLAGEARERVGAEADRAATEVASALSEAAHELQTMAAHAEHPDSAVAEAVRMAGQRAETTARRLHERGSQGVVDDLSRFARNRPGLFLLGAGALGFAVGRMVRNTDTASIVDAAKGELGSSSNGEADRVASTPGSGSSGAIDLRSPQPLAERGPSPTQPAAMPGVVGGDRP